jgi:hypothetical protein
MLSKISLLIFLLTCLAFTPVKSQFFMNYKGERVNEIDIYGQKKGIWKLFNTSLDALIIGKVKDSLRLDGAAYFYKGELLAKQYNDTTFDIAENGNLVRVYFKNREQYMKNLQPMYEKDRTKSRTKFNEHFVRADGTPFDEKIMRFFEQIAVSKPLFYDNFYEYLDSYMQDYGSAYDFGKIEVNFYIGVNGQLSDITIRKSTYPELDYFVVKMIKEMPRWQPAMMFGEFVRVNYTFPIVFNMDYKENILRKEQKRKQ